MEESKKQQLFNEYATRLYLEDGITPLIKVNDGVLDEIVTVDRARFLWSTMICSRNPEADNVQKQVINAIQYIKDLLGIENLNVHSIEKGLAETIEDLEEAVEELDEQKDFVEGLMEGLGYVKESI